MKNPLKNRLPLIAFAALPLTIGLGFAQQGTAATTDITAQARQSAQRAAQGQQRPDHNGAKHTETFIKNLATQLNTTPEKLRAAAVKAGNATIDAAVKAGEIPTERAAEMKQRLTENPFAFGGGRGPGGPGHRDGESHRGPRGQQPAAPAGNVQQDGTAADTSGT